MGILAWIIMGALAGWIASIVMGKNKRMGAIANIVVGIVGAFLGGAIMNQLGYEGVTGFDLWSLFVAILGAIVLIFVVGLIRK